MDLYLVRHAIAFDRDPGEWPDDALRPLTPDGERRFAEAARGLQRLTPGAEIDAVLSSPFVRAWRTAELLTEHARWPAPEPCAELGAAQPPTAVLGALRERSGMGALALVGHEPLLSELASLLLSGDEAGLSLEMKKGGVARLQFDGAAQPGRAVLTWLLAPRVLRSLATE